MNPGYALVDGYGTFHYLGDAGQKGDDYRILICPAPYSKLKRHFENGMIEMSKDLSSHV